MIKKMFYSTLNDEYYETKSAAQKAEDDFIENHFKNLEREAARKRRIITKIVNQSSSIRVK